MAAFACFSSNNEKSTDAYKDLITRFRKLAQEEIGEATTTISFANFEYYILHKGKSTHCYKDFIYQLRKVEMESPCLFMSENLGPQFTQYVYLIEQLQLKDGQNANAYYGEVKKIVTGFFNFFTHVIDDTIKRIDKFKNVYDQDILIHLVNYTIDLFENNHKEFVKEFLTLDSSKAQVEKLKEIENKNEIYMKQLLELKETLENMNKKEKMEEFVKDHFEIGLKKAHSICIFTHKYIALMLGDRIYEIAVSVAETVDRLNTNMRKYNEECNQKMNKLIYELYDKNKEHLMIHRRDRKRSIDTAEVNRGIEILKDKIEHYGNEETIARLELETRYWMKRMKDCNDIARVLTKVRYELDKMEEEEESFKNIRTTELPGSKANAFATMNKNFMERMKYLKEKWVETCICLMTFFCVRGTDRILYTDNVGSYYCDEFNHQNYISSHGLKFYHVNCAGDFLENIEADPYYFDENGRYILDHGKKIHQCAPCSSQYDLGTDGLFKKITVDCGHSEKINENCRMEIKDITDVVIMPKTDIVDISHTLDPKTTTYLWDNYGFILPEVLYEIFMAKSKNPIHFLAHNLQKHRYTATKTEIDYQKKMANQYKADIQKKRRDKDVRESLAWKAKMVQRRKPEESDDTMEWAVYNQQVADQQFINSLGYYYD